MVSFERMSRIMDILGKKKVISTTQLESLVYCSTSTLRRDLIALERDGKILRTKKQGNYRRYCLYLYHR